MLGQTDLAQQLPQGLLMLEQRIETIRRAVSKSLMVRIAHVEHMHDRLQEPEHDGCTSHEAQIGQRLVMTARSGLPDCADAGVAAGHRIHGCDLGNPVERPISDGAAKAAFAPLARGGQSGHNDLQRERDQAARSQGRSAG